MKNKYRKTSGGVKKKANQLGTSEAKGQHSGAFLEFSLCFIYLRLGKEEAGNPEIPMGVDKKKSQTKARFY